MRLCTVFLCAVLALPALPAAAQTVSAPDAATEAATGKTVIVDVRSPREWRQTGVAKDARRVTIHNPNGVKAFVADMLAVLDGDKSRPVSLICASGVRSERARRILEANGFTHVTHIPEGMMGRPGSGPGWIKRGLPVVPCPEC
jgi:rhodanese-related sulfurtransferase